MENNKPDQLITELEYAGWSEDNVTMKPLVPLRPIHGRVEMTLYAWGTASKVGDWTPEESKTHLRKARTVLKRYGVTGVPHRKLTLADLM